MLPSFKDFHRIAHIYLKQLIGCWNQLQSHAGVFGITFVDATSPEAIKAALQPGRTRMVWIETPANPMWGISDITAELPRSVRLYRPERTVLTLRYPSRVPTTRPRLLQNYMAATMSLHVVHVQHEPDPGLIEV